MYSESETSIQLLFVSRVNAMYGLRIDPEESYPL